MIHFRFLRMTSAQLEGFVPEAGQIVLVFDAKKVFIGDGGQIGGHLVGMSEQAVNELLGTTVEGLTVDSVQGLPEALADLLESVDASDLEAALAGKVNQSDFDELEDLVQLKANTGDLDAAAALLAEQTAVDALLTTVGGKAAGDYLDGLLPNKADQSALDALSTTVDTLGDQATFDTAIALKAPAGSVPDLTDGLAGKARQVDYQALKAVVDGKQNAAAFTTANNLKVSKATLFDGALIKASVLPSSVDDVLDFTAQSAFPAAGEKGKIYIASDVAKIFRWSGSAYIELFSPQLQKIATQAQALALTDNTVLMSPLQVFNVLKMVGVVQDANGNWAVIDEGTMGVVYDTNYLLVMDFEDLKDASTYKTVMTLGGTAALSNEVVKKGSLSLKTGTAGWVTTVDYTNLKTIGVGDYTIEFDVYIASTTSNYTDIFALVPAAGQTAGLVVRIGDGGFSNLLQLGYNMGGVGTIWSVSAINRAAMVGKWTNMIIQRKNGKTSIRVNGVLQTTRNSNNTGIAATEYADTSTFANVGLLRLGSLNATGAAVKQIYVDNLKISKVARY